MFRICFNDHPSGVILRIEGRFAGHFADEARQLIALRKLPAQFAVDLSDVTFVDSAGESALIWLTAIGGKFVADTAYSLHLCERLKLPQPNSTAHPFPTLSPP